MNDASLPAGGRDGFENGSRNSAEGVRIGSSRYEQAMNHHANIALMSDSQFSESLDALLDNFSDAATPSLPPFIEVMSSSAAGEGTISTVKTEPPSVFAVECYKPIDASSHEAPSAKGSLVVATQNRSFSSQSLDQPVPASLMPPPRMPQASYFSARATSSATASSQNLPYNFMPQHSQGTFGTSVGLGQPACTISSMHVSSNIAVAPTAFLAQSKKPFCSETSLCSSVSIDSPSRKRTRSTFPISEDDPDRRKRKVDRNAREQQRAQQVTDQIAMLRTLLEESGVSPSKADKFSTLVTVEQYVRQLQLKSTQLAVEHQKLLSSLKQTSELVNSQYCPPAPVSSSCGSGSEESASRSSDQDDEEGSLCTVKGMNYKWIFDSCPFAFAIASIDGRFLDCNKDFEELTGYSRVDLLPMEPQDSEAKDSSSKDPSSGTSVQGDAPAAKNEKKKKHNMSIFNVLNRDHIERLFCLMSKILQFHNDVDGDEVILESKFEHDGLERDTIAQEVQLCRRTNRKVCRQNAFSAAPETQR